MVICFQFVLDNQESHVAVSSEYKHCAMHVFLLITDLSIKFFLDYTEMFMIVFGLVFSGKSTGNHFLLLLIYRCSFFFFLDINTKQV